jgi:phytoene dehydrogenase-like protein
MTVASPAMRELDLEGDGVRWINPETVMCHPFADGSAVALRRDLGATAASLDEIAPGSGAPWRGLIEELAPHSSDFVGTILGRLPPVLGPARLMLSLRRDSLELARRLIGSVEAFGLDVFDGHRRPTAWLAGSAMHSGLPPDTAGSGAFGFLLQLVGHTHGWPLPEGGTQRVTDALLAKLARAGGQIRCSAGVAKILVRAGRTAGVELVGGEQVAVDAVVSTVSARPLAAMLPPEALPERLVRRLRGWRYGTAAFKVDWALSGSVPWSAPAAHEAGVVHLAGELEDLTRAAEDSYQGLTPQHPALVVGQQSRHDPTRAPGDSHTLYTYAHVPSTSKVPAEEIADRMQAQIERFAPGFSSLVLARQLRDTQATVSENPSLVGGDLAGGSCELDQQLVFRPAPELCRYKTPLKGLYVAGASIHPGGAVHGMSGRGAARALLGPRPLDRALSR